jgi:hypothetical protein
MDLSNASEIFGLHQVGLLTNLARRLASPL